MSTPSLNGPPTIATGGGTIITNPYFRVASQPQESVASGEVRIPPTDDRNDQTLQQPAPPPPKRRRGRPRKQQPATKAKESAPVNVFERMMKSSANLVRRGRKKRKSEESMDDATGNDANESQISVTVRESGKESSDELEALGGSGTKSSWSDSNLKYILGVREKMIDSVGFDERGAHEMYGEWPEWAAGSVVSFPDPLTTAKTHKQREAVVPSDFSRPDILLWAPELQFPSMYPHQRPCCPWHGACSCVRHDGFTFYPRRGIGRPGQPMPRRRRRRRR